jgi:tetratricopeptide (TPR) repeat protein
VIKSGRIASLAASAALAACTTAYAPPAPRTAASYADLLVGRVANLRQDYGAASDRYSSALAREPRNQSLIEGAVTAALASGNIDEARRAARMADRNDTSAYARLLLAADSLAAGRNRQAADQLSRVEGAAGEELVGRIMQVWTRAAEGQVDDVIADLTPLASIRPYGGLFSYQQAMALDFAGRNAEALTAYNTAAEGGMFLPPGVEHHADLLMRSGARAEAVALLQRDGNRSNPQLIAAAARLERGEPVSERITLARGAAAGLYGLAAIFEQENDSTNALASLSLALVLDPELDAARLMFAQVQSDLGHTDEARASLQQIGAASPYGASARVTEAWLLADAGEEDAALALAQRTAETGDRRAKRALADMYRNLERYDQAEPIYSELIAATPEDWRLYFARGAARERLGRWPEAEADFRHALELEPDQPDVMNYLGYSWVDRGENMEEGLAMLQRAFELRSNSGQIIDSLAWAYYRMGNYPQALAYMEIAIQILPADPTLNDHLGDVYWRLGRRIEARFQWQRALTYEPDHPETIQAKLENGLPEEPLTRSATR